MIEAFLTFFLAFFGPDAAAELRAVREAPDALTRRSRASEFLRKHPESEFRGAAWEAGALASFELGDEATGLYMARQALAIYPENPLLASSVAAVLANRGDGAGAREYAALSRRYLTLFRPVVGEGKRETVEIGGRRYPVDARIGSKWQEAYATRGPDGKLHVLPLQFNKLKGEWVNYWRMIDPPHYDRSDPALFGRFRAVTEYQSNCAPCHTSQWGPRESKEAGVNCEMCHGPGRAHAEGGRMRRLSARESVAVCAQCHAQSVLRTARGEFPPRYERRPYSEFGASAFHGDGRFRETTFIVEAFERSACYRKGEATCAHCHDPHPGAGKGNEKGLKFGAEDNGMCLQCHAGSAGKKGVCVECHMPKTMNALLFPARTHQIEVRRGR